MADEPQQAEHVNTAHQAIPVGIQPMPEFKPEAHVGAAIFRFVNGRCQHEQWQPTLYPFVSLCVLT